MSSTTLVLPRTTVESVDDAYLSLWCTTVQCTIRSLGPCHESQRCSLHVPVVFFILKSQSVEGVLGSCWSHHHMSQLWDLNKDERLERSLASFVLGTWVRNLVWKRSSLHVPVVILRSKVLLLLSSQWKDSSVPAKCQMPYPLIKMSFWCNLLRAIAL